MLDLKALALATGGYVVEAAYTIKKPVSVFKKKFNAKGLKQLSEATRIGIDSEEKELPRAPAQNKVFMDFMKSIGAERREQSGSSDIIPEGEATLTDLMDVYLDAYTKSSLSRPVDGDDNDNSRPGRTPSYPFLR